jgi:hypothetical protein
MARAIRFCTPAAQQMTSAVVASVLTPVYFLVGGFYPNVRLAKSEKPTQLSTKYFQ